jgi:transposase
MTLRVQQGKGRKDRYAMLSPILLERLRVWWRVAHAQGKMLEGGWLFAGLDPLEALSTRQLWAPRPVRLLCQGILTHEYTYAYLSCEPATGTVDALILPQVNTQCMQVFLDTVAARHANEHIVMVMDGAGWHSSKRLVAPSNIRLLALPPYAPELNPVEHLGDQLREKCVHNKVFSILDVLEDDLEMGLLAMENTPEVIQSITNWLWIINVLSKWK